MHYKVDIGPTRNSTAGTHESVCFTTSDVAVQYGREALRKIAKGRGRLPGTNPQLWHDGEKSYLNMSGETVWQSKVLVCHTIGCRARVRLPKTHK